MKRIRALALTVGMLLAAAGPAEAPGGHGGLGPGAPAGGGTLGGRGPPGRLPPPGRTRGARPPPRPNPRADFAPAFAPAAIAHPPRRRWEPPAEPELRGQARD